MRRPRVLDQLTLPTESILGSLRIDLWKQAISSTWELHFLIRRAWALLGAHTPYRIDFGPSENWCMKTGHFINAGASFSDSASLGPSVSSHSLQNRFWALWELMYENRLFHKRGSLIFWFGEPGPFWELTLPTFRHTSIGFYGLEIYQFPCHRRNSEQGQSLPWFISFLAIDAVGN